MYVTHDDIIECVQRNRKVEPARLYADGSVVTHETIAADIERFLAAGKRPHECSAGQMAGEATSAILPQSVAWAEKRKRVAARKYLARIESSEAA